jgi:hypothetical protein
VPIWVIVNPASGPGKAVDPNYTRAIARLRGAGCVLLGYVSTSYGKRPSAEVRADVDQWRRLYPSVHGTFFDEMANADTNAAVEEQSSLTRYAREAGRWPVVANPGADTPGRYFEQDAADVFIIHEAATWPSEERLRADRPGGYGDHPPFTRGILIHSQQELDRAALSTARKHVRWIYVTEAPFRSGDPMAANPWDRVSRHLEALCAALSSDGPRNAGNSPDGEARPSLNSRLTKGATVQGGCDQLWGFCGRS